MKACVVLGTRPEAIKMAPVIKKLQQQFDNAVKVCVTAQHREMLDQVLTLFEIFPDYDLNLMKKNQSLCNLTSSVLQELGQLFTEDKPNFILVHGDTTTTLAAAFSAFYLKIPVYHVEAGLRSYNMLAPWPEEMNRKVVGSLAELHFAPTLVARDNLLKEGVESNIIEVTGNTIVDALIETAQLINNNQKLRDTLKDRFSYLQPNKKLIFVTAHRRENFGKGIQNICEALKMLAENNDIQIVYPVHLNPNIKTIAEKILGNIPNVFLIEPQDYLSCVYLMQNCYLILTDSGGIQEEAPTFGKIVLVMRDVTERPEGIEAKTSILVGTNPETIVNETLKILHNENFYLDRKNIRNPYGDGMAAKRIVERIALNVS